MATQPTTYPGVDEVGLPTGADGGTAPPVVGEALDFGSVFTQVKKWVLSPSNVDKAVSIVVPWLKKQIGLSGAEVAVELPLTTPITQLVYPSQVAMLSPAVKKLTKGDLMALGGWGVTRKLPRELGLTTKDIQTIRDVFTRSFHNTLDEEPEAFSLSCCSCTPCCCAVAVMKPVRSVA